MLTQKDSFGNMMGPLTIEGAEDMANAIVQQKLMTQNKALFDEIDALYKDPTMNQVVKHRVMEVLYSQEFMRSNQKISLADIVQ